VKDYLAVFTSNQSVKNSEIPAHDELTKLTKPKIESQESSFVSFVSNRGIDFSENLSDEQGKQLSEKVISHEPTKPQPVDQAGSFVSNKGIEYPDNSFHGRRKRFSENVLPNELTKPTEPNLEDLWQSKLDAIRRELGRVIDNNDEEKLNALEEAIAERAAILEFDAKLSRNEAEQQAEMLVLMAWTDNLLNSCLKDTTQSFKAD
jgi:hypothetical protein